MSWQAALSLGIPALVAVAGYLVTYHNNLRLSERKDRLDRVTRQLSDFYGPLFATVSAGKAAWIVFRSQCRPGGAFWDKPGPPPTDEETAAWRHWMTAVFMPLNRRVWDVIVDHADLLDEERVPQLLLDACAHVAAYEAVIKRWEAGDYTEHKAPINFPADDLLAYAGAGVRRLKSEQQQLLRAASTSGRTCSQSRDLPRRARHQRFRLSCEATLDGLTRVVACVSRSACGRRPTTLGSRRRTGAARVSQPRGGRKCLCTYVTASCAGTPSNTARHARAVPVLPRPPPHATSTRSDAARRHASRS